MERDTYDKIWNIITDTAISLKNDAKKSNVIFIDIQRDEIYNRYQEFRDFIKEKHMEKSAFRIDRHKVAACMACAIMQVRPMNISRKDPVASDMRLAHFANECLAFFTALSIMKAFTKTVLEIEKAGADAPESDGVDISSLSKVPIPVLEKIVSEGYVFPNGKYDDYLIWQLTAFSDIHAFKDYILSLSCMLFFIESYTMGTYAGDITEI